MDSFTGCAGAVVFLLDENQPKSVKKLDRGRAIAIHAGGLSTIETLVSS
jgi:hypothetical protein